MSATVTTAERAENDFLNEGAPRALVRIAIPSFKVGWRKPCAQGKKTRRATIEEFQSLFQDDFRRSAKQKIDLTDEERRDFERSTDLRAALYKNDL